MKKKSNLKLALFALALFTAKVSYADEVKIPQCVSAKGKSVEFQAVDEPFLKVIGIKLAASLIGHYETPVVVLDIQNLQKLPIEFQQYVVYHECAHHQIPGHVDGRAEQLSLKKKNIAREAEADCLAVKNLVDDLNYGEKEMKIITQTLGEQLGASSNRKNSRGERIRKGQFKLYELVEVRNEKLMNCYKKAKSSSQK